MSILLQMTEVVPLKKVDTTQNVILLEPVAYIEDPEIKVEEVIESELLISDPLANTSIECEEIKHFSAAEDSVEQNVNNEKICEDSPLQRRTLRKRKAPFSNAPTSNDELNSNSEKDNEEESEGSEFIVTEDEMDSDSD